jgi:hypothetical protein
LFIRVHPWFEAFGKFVPASSNADGKKREYSRNLSEFSRREIVLTHSASELFSRFVFWNGKHATGYRSLPAMALVPMRGILWQS